MMSKPPVSALTFACNFEVEVTKPSVSSPIAESSLSLPRKRADTPNIYTSRYIVFFVIYTYSPMLFFLIPYL